VLDGSFISTYKYVIFCLDQFEEFFSCLPGEARRRFANSLAHLCSDDNTSPHLVFVLRDDLLAEMSLFKEALPEIFHHEHRLQRLSREQAALAITGPARLAGCEFEPDLIERLLEDLGEQGEIDPPQLQIVCDHLYDGRDTTGRITLAGYERNGCASRILAGYFERVLDRFGAVLRTKSPRTPLCRVWSSAFRLH